MKKSILLLTLLSIANTKTIGFCDIKGNVKKPGVYEIKENYTIQDVINLAGGLKDNSYTDNINLSKKVTDEMVIYIFNKTELKKEECTCKVEYVYSCPEEQDTNSNELEITTKEEVTTTETIIKKVNINTATLEELMTIKGLGESKSLAIINYRNEHGNFNSIEDLLNIKGIGITLLENIKEFIEL